MIRLSKDRVLEDFFIDDNGVITNKEGEVQKLYYISGRPYFKSTFVHKIQMWTKYGWRDGNKWIIHHIDEDKLNNTISNLVFMTRSQHMSLHTKESSPNKGKKLTKEHRKKIGLHRSQQCWYNDGIKNYFISPQNALPHYQKGMLKRCKK